MLRIKEPKYTLPQLCYNRLQVPLCRRRRVSMSAADVVKLVPFDASNAQTYDALCHCGAVQYAVTLSPPLAQQKIIECNCSICSRNGYLLVYPQREQVQITSGQEALKTYTFGPKRNLHHFCGRCGSAVFFDPQLRKRGEDHDIMGVNVGLELAKDSPRC
ncbi:hypothetical protein P171DRAFT_243862 [Karstenula rhodostoma CBS 690.94]|uniref:CENP-V/GFA domain-containing protein n=1 Tax=Karstenula rhodostoma CBS 690.94 TaxID=1392251 RepID=A0A9P4PMP8_9PLEO|nr:hypothetical protein P171DRAFT_243862 [Karstenula rhodostoma CBS 690.94]